MSWKTVRQRQRRAERPPTRLNEEQGEASRSQEETPWVLGHSLRQGCALCCGDPSWGSGLVYNLKSNPNPS